MNSISIIGRLTATPELKTTTSGLSVCSFTVAVDRSYTQKDDEKKTDFVDCVAWRKTAEIICKHFQKGNKIGVTGSLQTRAFEDKNGTRRKVSEIVVSDFDFCEKKESGNNENPLAAVQMDMLNITADANDDLPF